jgi:hypothetical protein
VRSTLGQPAASDHAPASVDLSDETEERPKTRTVRQIVADAEPTAAASVVHLSSNILGFNRFGRPARAARTLT